MIFTHWPNLKNKSKRTWTASKTHVEKISPWWKKRWKKPCGNHPSSRPFTPPQENLHDIFFVLPNPFWFFKKTSEKRWKLPSNQILRRLLPLSRCPTQRLMKGSWDVRPSIREDPGLTLQWTNSMHLKMDGWNISFLLGWPIFRCYVSFRECTFQ